MRLNLAVAIATHREEGRTVYACSTLRGAMCEARDPVLSAALAKLAGKARKALSGWIEQGKPNRGSPWLYDPEMKGTTVRLVLTLRDRTVRCKLFIVTLPLGDRLVAMATTVPEVVFELASLAELEQRASEAYTEWCQQQVKEDNAAVLASLSVEGDAWLESLEVEVEARVRTKKPIKNMLAALFGQGPVVGSEELNKVGQCLDYMVSEFAPAIGRKDLVDEIDHVLRRKDRQGVLIIGPPAVGKTAIFQECVMRRFERYQNRRGHKPQTWWISPQRLVSGMMYLGQWEQRWLAILREAAKRDHILYFEDLVGLYTAGLTRDSRLCAADVLKSFLSEHRVRIVGETTPEELAMLRRRDRALADRFHLVHVPSLSPSDTLPVALEATYRVETQKNAFYHPAVVPLAIRQQEVLAPNRAFPGKAIELIKAISDSDTVIDPSTLLYHLHQRTGTNLRLLYGHLGDQAHIEEALGAKVIGQDEAVQAMARVVVRFTQSLQPTDKPVGVLLFLGPTGVGKTESAKALTDLLFNDASHMIRIDMNEITTPLAAEQLVGTFDAPEGRLTAAVRRQPHAVILLDEIEKAHPDVFDYLLQVLGEGRLTDARGRVVDFRSSIIILTSNLGSTQKGGQLGFDAEGQQQSLAYYRAAERFFRPEFFNRIDEVIAFRPLTETDIAAIVLIQLRHLLGREGLKRRNVFVRVEREALEHVVKVGFDKRLGARAVRRALESEIVQPLGDQLSELAVEAPVLMRVSRQAGEITCHTLELEEIEPPALRPRPSLEQVVDVAKGMVERFDAELAAASNKLKASESSQEISANRVAYYTLHEHVFHCNSLLKSARYRLSLAARPRLTPVQGSPAAVKRSSTSGRGAGTRRMLREWMAEEDLRESIAKEESEQAHLEMSLEALTERLLNHLRLADAMLASVAAPRRWLLGMETLSRSNEDLLGKEHAAARLRNYFLEPELFFFHNLIECLDDQWQYEVAVVPQLENYCVVAGVSVAGLLGAVAGTYVSEGTSDERDLCALRALPLPAEVEMADIPKWIAERPILTEAGFSPQPAWQTHPSATIRGAIGNEVVDFLSGSRLRLFAGALSPSGWVDNPPTSADWADWWIGTLPPPPELRELIPSASLR
ncbi:MAG: AAA family ATPase [Aureliella sp.]